MLFHFQIRKIFISDSKRRHPSISRWIVQYKDCMLSRGHLHVPSMPCNPREPVQSFSQKRQAILFQKQIDPYPPPHLHPNLPRQVKVYLDASNVAQNSISVMLIIPHLNPLPILIHKIPIQPATISPFPASIAPDPLSGGAFTWRVIILIKAMQKTKLISKDFIRDCRTTREHERRETTLYALPALPPLPLPDCHSLFTHEEHYSIEDFILNLQTEELLYYNDPSDSPPLLASPRGPSIEQINLQYQQRMADRPSPSRPTQKDAKEGAVSFERELRAKYFREEDQPSIIGGSEEYVYECEEREEGSWGMEFI